MIIGIPREIKPEEKRVSVTPEGVKAFVHRGHTVFVEYRAGEGCGIPDGDYKKAGALVKREPSSIWKHADMIIKVKEPLSAETSLMREKWRAQRRQIIVRQGYERSRESARHAASWPKKSSTV